MGKYLVATLLPRIIVVLLLGVVLAAETVAPGVGNKLCESLSSNPDLVIPSSK